MNKPSIFKLSGIAVLIAALSGCYTQFATLDANSSDQSLADDSIEETTSDLNAKDTVVIKDRQICYWHRDFFGNRVLRCYKSYYDDDWYSYYSQPWWYGSYAGYRPDCDCNFSYYHGYTSGFDCDDYCYWYRRNNYYRRPDYYGGRQSSGSGSSPATNETRASQPAQQSARPGFQASPVSPARQNSGTQKQVQTETSQTNNPDAGTITKPLITHQTKNNARPVIGLSGKNSQKSIIEIPEVKKDIEKTPDNQRELDKPSPVRARPDTSSLRQSPARNKKAARQW